MNIFLKKNNFKISIFTYIIFLKKFFLIFLVFLLIFTLLIFYVKIFINISRYIWYIYKNQSIDIFVITNNYFKLLHVRKIHESYALCIDMKLKRFERVFRFHFIIFNYLLALTFNDDHLIPGILTFRHS